MQVLSSIIGDAVQFFRTWAGALLIGFVVGLVGTVGLTAYLTAQERADFHEQLAVANAKAAHYALVYRETAGAWQDLAIQVTEDSTLIRRLKEDNAALGADLQEAEAEILSLHEVTSDLQARLDSSLTDTERTGETEFTINLDERFTLQGGGGLRVHGPIVLETTGPTAYPDLTAEGSFPITIVVSRTPEGDVRVNAFTQDPRLTISRLDTQVNVDPPSPSFGFGSLTNQLFGVSPWVNRAIGFGACTALDAL